MEGLKNEERFIPLFPFSEQNKSVVIAKDQVLIKDSHQTALFIFNAEVRLDFLPRPRVNIHIINLDNLDILVRAELSYLAYSKDPIFLDFKNHNKDIKVLVGSCNLSNPQEYSLVFSPFCEPIIGTGKENTEMEYIVFHLFNFKKICVNRGRYCREIHLEADNWIVELKPSPKFENTFKKLKEEGGYGLTHMACLRKKDNTLISGKEAINMLDALQHFFSFAKGNWCNPVCAVGFNSSDKVWESWSSPIESCFSEKGSWFDEHHSEQLENLFPGFVNLWVSEDWNSTLQKVIYWYIISNTSRVDAGVVLTQSALERLSYEHFKVNPIKVDNAAVKLRNLFSNLNIPVELTEENTPILKKLAEEINKHVEENIQNKNKKAKMVWNDAPRALSGMRNYLVHPINEYNNIKLGHAIPEAWNLGLWYLELSLIKECGYTEEHYRNRLIPGCIGDVEKVPWEK